MSRRRGAQAALCLVLAGALWPPTAAAAVELPTIFGSNMVLQSGIRAPIWGRAKPGEGVTVEVAGQSHATRAGASGAWRVELDPLEASDEPLTLTVRGENTIVLEDVLVGEVWLCAGQSNMRLPVDFADDSDLELAHSDYPNLRLISVVSNRVEKPQSEFIGSWQPSWPSTVGHFSAVCFFFGRELHEILRVPVGLIQSAEHNSACEAWMSRPTLAADPRFRGLLRDWAKREAEYEKPKPMRRPTAPPQPAESSKKTPAALTGKDLLPPRPPKLSARRPANLYNSLLHPIIGYGIRGVLWYQGESNIKNPRLYRDLFPAMIREWRREWRRDDLPFYWIQLPGFGPRHDSGAGAGWALVREAQTLTARDLPHTAQAVTIDIGGPLHPKNKRDFARRLLRPVLAREYGLGVAYENPTLEKFEVHGDKAVLTFAHVGDGLAVCRGWNVAGFALAGSDHAFVAAEGDIVGDDKVEVRSETVPHPVAVRYAFGGNPRPNLCTRSGLPATPFRTDDWTVEIRTGEETHQATPGEEGRGSGSRPSPLLTPRP
jgi:sialate O-acetylesterase